MHKKILLFNILTLFAIALACLLPAASAHAQNRSSKRTVTGIVTDEGGNPLPGAHVEQVRQTDTESIAAVVVDVNGHFSLTLPHSAKEIRISFIGLETQLVSLTDEANYRIVLKSTV